MRSRHIELVEYFLTFFVFPYEGSLNLKKKILAYLNILQNHIAFYFIKSRFS